MPEKSDDDDKDAYARFSRDWAGLEFINKLLWKPEENWVRPRILSRLKAFIDTAKLYHHVPTMKNMALAMLARLQERWPDAKFLQVYPAFSSAL